MNTVGCFLYTFLPRFQRYKKPERFCCRHHLSRFSFFFALFVCWITRAWRSTKKRTMFRRCIEKMKDWKQRSWDEVMGCWFDFYIILTPATLKSAWITRLQSVRQGVRVRKKLERACKIDLDNIKQATLWEFVFLHNAEILKANFLLWASFWTDFEHIHSHSRLQLVIFWIIIECGQLMDSSKMLQKKGASFPDYSCLEDCQIYFQIKCGL